MYGYAPTSADENNLVRNEISFQNLIAVANNKILFEALDEQTKQELVLMVASYTKACLEEMKKGKGNDCSVAEIFKSR